MKTEKELKKEIERIKEVYELAQTIPLHKDFVPSVNTILTYEILEAQLKTLQERNTEIKQAIEKQIELVEDGCDEQVESMKEPNYCGSHDKDSHRGIFLCGHCEDTRIRFEELLQKLGLEK